MNEEALSFQSLFLSSSPTTNSVVSSTASTYHDLLSSSTSVESSSSFDPVDSSRHTAHLPVSQSVPHL